MANNYTQFSEVIPHLTPDEEKWLRSQFATICVFDGKAYAEDALPADMEIMDADWIGCLVYLDVSNCYEYVGSVGEKDAGFEYDFANDHDTDGWGRHLWIHAEESGYVDGVMALVQKFLKKFRPDQCWSLTYATTCSKPRVGEFSGGAVFVTADAIRWQNAYDFVEQQRAAFEQRGKPRQEETDHGETTATEP